MSINSQIVTVRTGSNRRSYLRSIFDEAFVLRWRSFDNRNTLSLTETVYQRQIRPFGKTKKSLGKVHLPDGLAHELLLWKSESPDAFMFPNATGFLDVGNYRYRTLKPLADKLGIPKLNFQILRRTMAIQAQNMGSVKDIQAHLRHAKADTTANKYMQARSQRAFSGWSVKCT
jgi:integrase